MLVVADLSAIENRALAWLSGCESMLEIYEKGLDPYKDFATRLYMLTYDDVSKQQRQICKPAVLGCGYGLGPGTRRTMANGSHQWTGLMAYASSMGVALKPDDSRDMVHVFRRTFHEVPQYWRYMEEAFYAATKTKKRQQVGSVIFGYSNGATYIELPVGRRIHYLNPRAWHGPKGIEIRYDGLRNGQWWTVTAWGGVLTENVVQAVSRDVLVEGMLRAESRGLKIVGHCHDEIIAESSGPSSGLDQLALEQAMSEPISWAPGLPLAAEGWEGERYAKA
jgi:DNA polymerase bacteriophage-type